jgi:hypothetical protein
MNCKPGDLAVIVSDPRSRNLYEGAHLRVVADSGRRDAGSVLWTFEPLSPILVQRLKEHPGDTVSDHFIRPIRPGEITDEEVRELYAPKQPEVA